MNNEILVSGAPGSPYTRKMVALLRYRQIAHRVITRGAPEDAATPQPKVPIIPVLVFPGEDVGRVDSTPLIASLEEHWPGRRVVPDDPALAFLDALIEDFGDEWLTKAMFHYRWYYQPDIDKAAAILPRWRGTAEPEETLAAAGKAFANRQIGRLWVVGSNDVTAPVIEASYTRTLQIIDRCLIGRRFVLGARPGAGDFGLYGQLTQLCLFDPTPMDLALRVAPRVVAWTQLVDDLSGVDVDEDGFETPESLPSPVLELFGEIGRVYAPFLLANAAALETGAEKVECEIDGARWVQQPFPYQGRCLAELRNRFARLEGLDRARVLSVLDGTGCEYLFRA